MGFLAAEHIYLREVSVGEGAEAEDMLLELLLGLISLILLVWWFLSPPSRLRAMGDKIPGPPPFPLVGNAVNFQIIGPKALEHISNAQKNYGPVFRIWLGPQLHVLLCDATNIQFLLSSTSLITKANVYKSLNEWLGTGLLISTGDLWHKRRKAITPTFHFKILDECIPVFEKCANTLIDLLKAELGKETFNLTPYLSNCALDTVSQSAMGVEVEAQTKPKSYYATSVLGMTKVLGLKINYPWLGVEPLYSLTGQRKEEQEHLKALESLPKKVLEEKKSEFETKTREESPDKELGIKKRYAFLELLLEVNKKNNPAFQNDQDIMDEVKTFMFEGHDTTTACLSFTFWCLGKYPDVQEEVYKEVSRILENKTELKMEDLQEMKYLERVIKESLRLYPPVPVIGRRFEEDTVLPSGHTIPAGTDVYAPIILVHRNSQYFEDPETFNPDRFLNEMKHPYAYIPFSAGPRNCIGQKFAMTDLKSIISKTIFTYKIHSEGEIQIVNEMILRAVDGPNVSLTLRQKN